MGSEEKQNLTHEKHGNLSTKSSLRDSNFETMSGVPVEPVYGDDLFPGQYPYTRGIYPLCTGHVYGR